MAAGVAGGKTIGEPLTTLVGVAGVAGGTVTADDSPQPLSMNPTMSRSSSKGIGRAFCIATANSFLLGQRVTRAAARRASGYPAIWLLAICQALPDFTFRRISLREMAVNSLSAPVYHTLPPDT
jgi:hypothetical protein